MALQPALGNSADRHPLADAVNDLLAGRLVVIPTETVYGLAADATRAEAVSSIFALKGRPADHPLIVHIGELEHARWWIGKLGSQQARYFETLAASFWPGPLTLIVPLADHAPRFASAGQATLGLRMPAHPLAQTLLHQYHQRGGRGLAAPSANRFGRISPTSAQHVRDDLGDQAPLILDGGPCQVGLESTIVDLSRHAPVLLRPGAVSHEALEHALGRSVSLSPNLIEPEKVDHGAPRASGTLAAHYAPLTPTRLISQQEFQTLMDSPEARTGMVVGLPLDMDPHAYGAALYARLRELDRRGANEIVVEAPPEQAEWLAVRDRLQRAAYAHRSVVFPCN